MDEGDMRSAPLLVVAEDALELFAEEVELLTVVGACRSLPTTRSSNVKELRTADDKDDSDTRRMCPSTLR